MGLFYDRRGYYCEIACLWQISIKIFVSRPLRGAPNILIGLVVAIAVPFWDTLLCFWEILYNGDAWYLNETVIILDIFYEAFQEVPNRRLPRPKQLDRPQLNYDTVHSLHLHPLSL